MFEFFFLTKVTAPSQSMWLGVRFQKNYLQLGRNYVLGLPIPHFLPWFKPKISLSSEENFLLQT